MESIGQLLSQVIAVTHRLNLYRLSLYDINYIIDFHQKSIFEPKLRGYQWNLTKSIWKRRLSRGLICIRFDILTILNLSNYRNDEPKWPTWSCFDNLTESSDLIGWLCQIIETGSRGSFWLVVSIIWQIQNCQNIETNAYQVTWQSPLSNGSCQIPLIAPYSIWSIYIIWTMNFYQPSST